jgi:hypothetical protein
MASIIIYVSCRFTERDPREPFLPTIYIYTYIYIYIYIYIEIYLFFYSIKISFYNNGSLAPHFFLLLFSLYFFILIFHFHSILLYDPFGSSSIPRGANSVFIFKSIYYIEVTPNLLLGSKPHISPQTSSTCLFLAIHQRSPSGMLSDLLKVNRRMTDPILRLILWDMRV